ncbi:AAA family ATPase [Parasediminibacterium sp. JCM 36343]|uniref:AAA family ATPase n=1 Tax=Parasediminibacterium sp. JCM 36343 TaxID=3374279 RepID=UPI003978CD4F
MKETLIIKNFGPIKSVELELGRFNVFIGEQGTGKSTVAKLLAVCRYFSYITIDSPFNQGEAKFREGLSAWGLNDSIKKDSYIYYKCKHYSVVIEQKPIKITENIPGKGISNIDTIYSFMPKLKAISNEFTNLLSELERITKPKESSDYPQMKRAIPTSFFLNDVASVMDNPFYLPTERGLQSIFSLGKDSIPNISNFLYNYFDKTANIFFDFFSSETVIEPLEITYKNVYGKSLIKNKDHDFINLSNGASGYQSTIPVVLLIKYYTEIRKKAKTFIIEEPELNLFPSAQNKLMKFLVDKTMNYGNSILLTTHSPYILISLNNLMYAYQVGQEHKEEVSKIIEEKYWINPEDVSAYRLLSDGTARNIIDEELKEIRVEEMDEVSKALNADYDRILDIKFAVHETA